MREPIRVLVVDDSALIRQMLVRALGLDPGIEVVGWARNGVEAIEQSRKLQPDVITLDVEMPELSGLEALPHIVRDCEARVLMLSSQDDPEITYQALASGAVDFISKPHGGFASSLSELSDELVKKIKTAYRIDPARLRAGWAATRRIDATVSAFPSGEPASPRRLKSPPTGASESPTHIVALAASTGGPPALERVFSGLPQDLPVAYMVVQHLPAGFTRSFAGRLSRISGMPVVEAEDGMRVRPGHGYLAAYGRHMIVEGSPGRSTVIELTDDPPVHGVRPAADPLLFSLAKGYGPRATGVLLTGMGTDGAEGLLAVRRAGGHTIAQDEGTSVVWGMPGAAVRIGAAESVEPLEKIAIEVRRHIRGEA
jgi:two-component system chemotaxis response regulator CheB